MSALVGAIVGGWAYALSRRRMAATPAILSAVLLELIAVAPFPIGWPPNTLSHAMIYNRYGYALLGLVVLECFRPGGTKAESAESPPASSRSRSCFSSPAIAWSLWFSRQRR